MEKWSPSLAPSLVLGTALVVAASIVSWSAVKIKNSEHTIVVTGSARQRLTADKAIWSVSVAHHAPTLAGAYPLVTQGITRVKAYLVAQGIAETEITSGPIQTQHLNVRRPDGSEAEGDYQLEQSLTVTTKDIPKVEKIAREVTQLINEGIPVESHSPQYIVTNLADAKVQMLAEAARNARLRAQKIAESVGSRIGNVRAANMGVLQITPADSTTVSSEGINDTSSIEKDITSVVTMTFGVE